MQQQQPLPPQGRSLAENLERRIATWRMRRKAGGARTYRLASLEARS